MEKKENSKNKQKNKISVFTIGIIAIILIAMLVIIIISFNSMKKNKVEKAGDYAIINEEGNKENSSPKMEEEKSFENVKFTDIKIEYKDEATYITANVTNTSNEKISEKMINIKLLNDKQEEVENVKAYIPDLEVGETKEFTTAITLDVVDIYDIQIENVSEI